jgi:hypothetical protein
MKIPIATLLIFVSIVSLLLVTSCKKEVNEKQSVKSIKEIVVQKTISKEKFKEELVPKIKELYEKDPKKYRILNNIAEKALSEKNPKIFNMQVSDIRSEMKYIK